MMYLRKEPIEQCSLARPDPMAHRDLGLNARGSGLAFVEVLDFQCGDRPPTVDLGDLGVGYFGSYGDTQ